MVIKKIIKRIFFKEEKTFKKNRFLEFINPDLIFDIGANNGLSAKEFIESGFNSDIYSFEPVSHLFETLTKNSIGYSNWKIFNQGVGEKNEKLNIKVSGGHGGASSFMEMTDKLIEIAPDQKVFKEEEVEVITLNQFCKSNNITAKKIFVKIDVQGFEMNVLKGANEIFNRIAGIKIETSIIKQYKNESDIFEILPYLLENGFSVYAFENGWRNPNNNELLQVDILLFNKKLV